MNKTDRRKRTEYIIQLSFASTSKQARNLDIDSPPFTTTTLFRPRTISTMSDLGFPLLDEPMDLDGAYRVLRTLLSDRGLPTNDQFEHFGGAKQHQLVDAILKLLNACLDRHAEYHYEADCGKAANGFMRAHFRDNDKNPREKPSRKYKVGEHAIVFGTNKDRKDFFEWYATKYLLETHFDPMPHDGEVTEQRYPDLFEAYEVDQWHHGTVEEEILKHDEQASTIYLVTTMPSEAQLEVNDDTAPHDAAVQFLPKDARYRVYDPSFVFQDQHRSQKIPRKVRYENALRTMHPIINAVQRLNPSKKYTGELGGGGNYDDTCRQMSLRWIAEQVAEWTELPGRPRKLGEKGFERGRWNYFTIED
ncbi:uncharacterized protein J3D65DRAFT_681817 [Phyllosticta citribraziliensis]|uniref:Uncharacterized protein n=1 Tax=Phyllosticta citribraziliensis TaxID=989973 RepID=A0ABR1L1J7_9PEZI